MITASQLIILCKYIHYVISYKYYTYTIADIKFEVPLTSARGAVNVFIYYYGTLSRQGVSVVDCGVIELAENMFEIRQGI